MGDSLIKEKADPRITKEKLAALGKHSVWAKGRQYNSSEDRLEHDEMIVYDPPQALPRYIVACSLIQKKADEVEKLEAWYHTTLAFFNRKSI